MQALLNLLADNRYKNSLTAEKAMSIIENPNNNNFNITGFVLTDKDGDVAIVDKGAVKWLYRRPFYNLMQESE